MTTIAHRSILLALCLGLAACGKGGDEPGRGARRDPDAPPGCDEAAGRLAMARPFAVGGDNFPKLALAMSEACNAQAWPAAVRTCLAASANKAAAANACIDQLEPAARTASIAAIEQAARTLGSPSPTW